MLSKLYKLSRRRGLQMEAFGSILTVTVMLTDRFCLPCRTGMCLPRQSSPPYF